MYDVAILSGEVQVTESGDKLEVLVAIRHHTAPAASPVIETAVTQPLGRVCAAVVISISADWSAVGADHEAEKTVLVPHCILLRLAVNDEVDGGTGVFVGVGV